MSDRSRILILDNDPEMSELISRQLEQHCFESVCFANGDIALKALSSSFFDLVILNWNLPEISGVDVLKAIRKIKSSNELSILILTNHIEPEALVLALDAGADDYLVKPFERSDLLSRVKALIRRVRANPTLESGAHMQAPSRVHLGALELDTKSFDVFCKSERVHLTPSEFKLLHALAVNRGKVLTRDHLITLVQGEGIAVIDRAVDTHIFGLRKKLGEYSEAIETVRGVGYRVKMPTLQA
jgi:DNA-binding response OmpR family regulator